jgi:hypothetical protein
MSTPAENEFHDPVLKKAVHRCWAGECASEALRARVTKLLEQDASASASAASTPGTRPSMRLSGRLSGSVGSPASSNRFSWMVWPTALAALLLLSFGLSNYFRATTGANTGTNTGINTTVNTTTAIALPADLESNLILTHDGCCSHGNHQHLPVPKTDDVGIVKAMHDQLGRPVIMFRPADTSWAFRGASICPVGTTLSGHLVFTRAGGDLSIFSLPKTILPNAPEGSVYSATVNEHRIVGFVKDGAVFCIVSSGPTSALSIDELKQMQTQMQPTVAINSPPQDEESQHKVLLTELLRDSRP